MLRNGLLRDERRKKRTPSSNTSLRFFGILLLALLTALFLYFDAMKVNTPQMDSIAPKALVIINRHGARYPLSHHTFENLTWDGSLGQLSVVGLKQAFEFGKELNYRYYTRSTKASLDPESFEIYANYIHRTEDTARGIVLGIKHGFNHHPDLAKGNCRCRVPGRPSSYSCIKRCLGLESIKLNNEELPVIEVLEKDSEKLGVLLQHEKCKGWMDRKHSLYENSNLELKARQLFSTQYSLVYKLMQDDEICIDQDDIHPAGNQSVPVRCKTLDISGIEEVWGNIMCGIAAGRSNFTFPFDPVSLADKLATAVIWKWHKEFSVENGPYCGGMLLDDILNKIVAIVTNSVDEDDPSSTIPVKDGFKTLIYSGHDSTIASLLSALGVRDWHYPPFLSHIVLTVMGPSGSTNINTHWLEMRYDDITPQVAYCKSGICSLSTLIDKLADFRVPLASCEHVD